MLRHCIPYTYYPPSEGSRGVLESGYAGGDGVISGVECHLVSQVLWSFLSHNFP